MGGRGQTLKKKLSNGEDIFIKGNELKKSSKETVLDKAKPQLIFKEEKEIENNKKNIRKVPKCNSVETA